MTGDNAPSSFDVANDLSAENKNARGTTESSATALSIEDRYEAECDSAKIRHWKESPYAVGCVEITWVDETRNRGRNGNSNRCCADTCSEEIEPNCCCLQLSGVVCPLLGAKRLGNMVVIKESVYYDENNENDEEQGGENNEGGGGGRTRKYKMDMVVGPYWPVLFFVTYPLVYGVSLLTAFSAIPHKHPGIIALWAFCTVALWLALFNVSCRDPGILKRRREPPPDRDQGARWRWSDQAQTYRPRGAYYDADCAVVVDGFDHVCPWTGTAIGKGNMTAFQWFVAMVFICLVMDVLLLTGAI
eukprot:CAMPEP_0195517646 /NCGR_PEP_ID=MMETSP0794_2-20130614/11176_1 /TAXON_ID=515487 /ORGANISM="Stephanopyxis turris, Strain CCMP 815" /LENGTH=301 /DNA_ID=CAMNT_0040646481 /DNA_START=191 /DNA_END=1096 /DNA_ORIENTATION=-